MKSEISQQFLLRSTKIQVISLSQLHAGIDSDKFFSINGLEHRFPQQAAKIGFAIALLHNHDHASPNSYLVYKKDFTEAEYMPPSQARSFYPCSWSQENGAVVPYEFSDQEIPFEIDEIKKNLEKLSSMNYNCYGRTVRPIRNVAEFETENGHVYVPLEKVQKQTLLLKNSQTAINGLEQGGCYLTCFGIGPYHSGKRIHMRQQ